MSKRNLVRCVVLSVAMIAVCGAMNQLAVGADSSPIAAGIDTFSSPEGGDYFAMTLKPAETAPAAGGRDVVILFNTSASQAGEYRTKGLEALASILAELPVGDRVRLMAIDTNAVALTEDFVAADGPEMAEALAELHGRTPLGATDMKKALDAAADSFAGDANRQRAVVYIGDGRSAANPLDTEEFEQLIQKLVDAHIPVNSYILGVRVDRQLPGALAVQTGGAVILDTMELTGPEAGGALVAAAKENVLWPTSVAWPAEMTEVLPKRLPPLRGDRETVIVGTLKGKGPFGVEVTAQRAGGLEKLEFAVPASVSDDSNSYLTQLVARARLDGGLTLPLLGAASLAEARQEIEAGVQSFSRLARQALAAGNLDNAERFVEEALRQDPNDTEALAIQGALAKRRSGDVPAAGDGVVVLAGPGTGASDAPAAGGATDLTLIGPDAVEPPPGAMAEGFQRDRRIIAQVIQAEVRNTIGEARSLMSTNPQATSQQLKLTLEKVRRTAELNPDVRDQMVDLIQAALREAARRKVEVDYVEQQRLESVAAAKERMLIADNLLRSQQKVKQLMNRFDSLMQEGRYSLAEEASAEAEKIVPDSPVPIQAKLDARMVGYYNNIMALREERQKRVIDTLYEVEKSYIPFPDNPPIVYPDAEVWQQLTARRKEKYSSMDLAKQGPSEKKIRDALKSATQLEFFDAPLSDVIDYLKDYHDIEIQLDTRALEDVGITSQSPVTKTLKGISLKSALRLLLRDLSLTYVIEDEVLLITTPEEAENRLSTKVYPVADLVIPVQTPMGGMGMGGGMGMMGGMGGMGGGMGGMGGGMGGMGGGMGGMGGGMGGMGMFNLPQELLPKVPAGGFQAFAVEDDLSVGVKDSAATPAKVESPVNVENQATKIDIEAAIVAEPGVVWDVYFLKNKPEAATVREAVRQLMGQREFDHVVGLTGAALRHGQGQPWMYEAMALALDAAGRPKAEVERAVMSAVDFVDNTTDLMYIGAYLAQIGLNERALQVYRQAAAIEPLRPEPYMLGLRAARTLDDLDGLKWASLGILSQAWPKEQADIWQAGLGVAKEVLDRLQTEDRTKEAEEFEAALDEAVARDCVAIVTWTGEADVDVLVEEPSGTVCSLRSPRTAAGGVLLGDAISQTGRDSYGGHSEVYVCPKGFDGTYRLLVRRVWGDVTTGKVNVEVMTHYGTGDAIAVRKKIPLNKDEAVVAFDLTNGRRKEPLRQQQVANAVGGQLALNRQILAQQLASSVDPSVLQALALSRATGGYNTTGGNGGGSGNGLANFFGGGAVGYQPVIITLPEGANLMATAVVSADRRYVRVTAMPMFSGVAEVNVFNTATGANTEGQGGTGGQGFSGLFGGGTGGGGGGFGGGGGGGVGF